MTKEAMPLLRQSQINNHQSPINDHRVQLMAKRLTFVLCLAFFLHASRPVVAELPEPLGKLIRQTCFDCHTGESAEGGLDLGSLAFTLDDRKLRDRWILIHDRVNAGKIPHEPAAMADRDRQSLVKALHDTIARADRADVLANGSGPLRRLNRDEYEQKLRDVLKMPLLDIRDMLPEDREAHRFNKTASALDMSRVKLAAYMAPTKTRLAAALAR